MNQLIYLDPPFFSNRNYEVLCGDKGEIRSFQDRWSGGIDHYIAWLKERVIEMHRVLKPTGSIFLHCDWHADSYIRVFILDKIFGEQNFQNKITWRRADTHNDAKKKYPNICDDIYFYSKSDKFTFNVQYGGHTDKTLKDWYQYLEFSDGTIRPMTKEENKTQQVPLNSRRFNADNMASPNPRPNLMYEYKGYSCPAKGWRYSLETMQDLDAEGKLLFPKDKTGRIMLKRYLDEQSGSVVGDVWDDITQIRAIHKERIGYPTQKPEALLERIIQCASNDDDLILDPFLGGGTTIAVADRLKRQWIGIDSSVAAIKVSELRLNKQRDLFSVPFTIQLHKYDYHTLRNNNAFEFETWIIQQYGGQANIKQRGDLGIDGRDKTGTPIQVKRSDNIGRNVIDNFKAACERYDKNLADKNKQTAQPIGIIIAFSFGKGAIHAIATVNIEFYAWDWNYNMQEGFKPAIVRDTAGKQIQKFKSGVYCIAVMVIDNDGLENIAVLNFKINEIT